MADTAKEAFVGGAELEKEFPPLPPQEKLARVTSDREYLKVEDYANR